MEKTTKKQTIIYPYDRTCRPPRKTRNGRRLHGELAACSLFLLSSLTKMSETRAYAGCTSRPHFKPGLAAAPAGRGQCRPRQLPRSQRRPRECGCLRQLPKERRVTSVQEQFGQHEFIDSPSIKEKLTSFGPSK